MNDAITEVTDTPRDVECIENTWIEMSDGTRLAARIWRPVDAEYAPVPAILEYIPYRKRDLTRPRDQLMHPFVAGHGYACVRVDLRGSGDSQGVLQDEYLQQELDDGVEVIRWLAGQSWCSGDVGMIGISWGGFNGLQIAAMQPPELKAIITASSTDDRYADDVHHMGGCLLGDNLSWASVMFAFNAMPPDPEIVGGDWRDMWHERLDGSGLWLEKWLRHQRRDEYWSHGSVCEDYGAIQCPVFAVSGWADGYSNTVFRLLRNLDVPRKGLIGPWSHKYPHIGTPGPAVDFLKECIRWWDHWLKGIDTGVMDEPMLRVWMQDSVEPTSSYTHRPGHWVGEEALPSPHVHEETFTLVPDKLVAPHDDHPAEGMEIQSPLTVGLFAGKWCSYDAGPDLAHDQRQEDGGALVFDTDPMENDLELLGAPYADLEISSSAPIAMVAVRLSDVRPDGGATRLSYGLLNLTHRDNRETPSHLEPGVPYRVRVPLNDLAQNIPAGHRLRASISTSYWPLAWAPPVPVKLMIAAGASTFTIPVRPPRTEDDTLADIGPPKGAPAEPTTTIEPGHHNWLVHRDLATDISTLEVINDSGTFRLDDIELVVTNRVRELYSSRGSDFTSLKGEVTSTRALSRGDWSVTTHTHTVLTSSETAFHIQADLDAFEGDERVFCRSWHYDIPRDFI